MYINTKNTENKQEGVEVITDDSDYDLLGINETWWEYSHKWNVNTNEDEYLKEN